MEVPGIILVLSCQKHVNTRLVKFRLPKNDYHGWKVLYVIGDLTLESNYELRDNNMLYIKCEDSYIHLLKKLALSIKYVMEIFKIEQGILRCGDDLYFNETRLEHFLTLKKPDFLGKAWCNKNYYSQNTNVLKKLRVDPFMFNYYKTHQEDFSNPMHNLKDLSLDKLRTYSLRPDIWGPSGVIYYLSIKTCNILVKHMENIAFNIFHFDEFTKSYPYTIEDCAVTYIMYYNCIPFTNYYHFFDTGKSIAKHTNEFK